ncbi:unnamed protein product [Rotaria magnacalcarata]|uniref:Uncharacterized protein n=1 Tax=Rotaria magnacalcarata TaxID=392030 RepID=A0A816R2B4_9BILA|nr:unnamed protein product [Rotaria magnacalcarata]CAF3880268.1 unnamed protein product [Rotaria magnacalcarata]
MTVSSESMSALYKCQFLWYQLSFRFVAHPQGCRIVRATPTPPPPETVSCSSLLELHVSVSDMKECLYVLDGRFDQLRIFYLIVYRILSGYFNIEHKYKLLPNVRFFSLCCKEKIHDFDELIVPRLRRMLNLKELDLNVVAESHEKFIDGDTLQKYIIIYMPQLHKFTFNICSTINHRNFSLNEHIQKMHIISQYHIYSYRCKLKVYSDITNNFPGRLFTSVTKVSLYDERPFEHEFFLRIAESFPFMKELTIENRKALGRLIKRINDNQILSIIEYPNLNRLDLTKTHDDYIELSLFDTKMSLPHNIHHCVGYHSLKRVTYCFTRYITGYNCAKLPALYLSPVDERDESVHYYLPHTCIPETSTGQDFLPCPAKISVLAGGRTN